MVLGNGEFVRELARLIRELSSAIERLEGSMDDQARTPHPGRSELKQCRGALALDLQSLRAARRLRLSLEGEAGREDLCIGQPQSIQARRRLPGDSL